MYVHAVDRLKRDAIDVSSTVKKLREKGGFVEVRGLGEIAKGVGDLILAALSLVADMKRKRINERTLQGRILAQKILKETGKPSMVNYFWVGQNQKILK